MTDTNGLRQGILDRLDRRAEDILGSPSLSAGYVVNREINLAIQHYESHRFRWNEVRESEFATTASGTRIYSLPANFLKMDTIKCIYNNSYIPLRKLTWDQIEERDRQVAQAEGIPFEYAIYGNVLRVYPVPNVTLTLAGSYLARYPQTSLTGSYCAVQTMGGGSFTATTTASHNNRLNGWTTDGSDLVMRRAEAAIRIAYFQEDNAIAEMGVLNSQGLSFLSIMEQQAYQSLADETMDFGAAGIVQPYNI